MALTGETRRRQVSVCYFARDNSREWISLFDLHDFRGENGKWKEHPMSSEKRRWISLYVFVSVSLSLSPLSRPWSPEIQTEDFCVEYVSFVLAAESVIYFLWWKCCLHGWRQNQGKIFSVHTSLTKEATCLVRDNVIIIIKVFIIELDVPSQRLHYHITLYVIFYVILLHFNSLT